MTERDEQVLDPLDEAMTPDGKRADGVSRDEHEWMTHDLGRPLEMFLRFAWKLKLNHEPLSYRRWCDLDNIIKIAESEKAGFFSALADKREFARKKREREKKRAARKAKASGGES